MPHVRKRHKATKKAPGRARPQRPLHLMKGNGINNSVFSFFIAFLVRVHCCQDIEVHLSQVKKKKMVLIRVRRMLMKPMGEVQRGLTGIRKSSHGLQRVSPPILLPWCGV